ncbi:MAG: hypothetical protein ABIQ31_02160 [Ferruginibacter sp.]
MKKYTILLLLIIGGLVSCKKQQAQDANPVEKISIDDATLVSKGSLTSTSLKLTGVAKIYLQKNGKYILALEQIKMNSNSDLSVYFSYAPSLSSTSIKLFSFKKIDGQMYYELPAGVAGTSFPFLLIQGDISQLPDGIAELKKA